MPTSPTVLRPVAATAIVLAPLLAASLALAATPDPLLPNGGFESGAAGWSASGGQLVVVAEPVRTGIRAGRLAASGQGLVAFLESGFVSVTAGTPYTLTGSVYYTDTAAAWTQLRITWYADTTSTAMPILPQSAPILAPVAGWQSFAPLVTTPPAGARAAKVRAVVGLAALNQPGAAVFDDLSLQGPDSPTATATPAPSRSTTPTATAKATATPTATATPAPSHSATSTATPTATPTPTPMATAPATPAPTHSATSTATPAVYPSKTPTATPAPFTTALPGDVLFSEVQAHPASGGGAGEWLELYNRSGAVVVLAGWRVEDNHGSDPLPAISLPPGAFAVVAANQATFRALFPAFSGPLFIIDDGLIGNGLADDGDRLILRDGAGAVIDELSYGSDASIFDPAAPAVAAGHSLERWAPSVDTDTAADFADNSSPSPGGALPTPTVTVSVTTTRTATPSRAATATPTATSTPSPTATWQPGAVRINEFLPAPQDVDWDGDGAAGSSDEWIELKSVAAAAVDLGGWRLGDAAGGPGYTIPPGQWIDPGGFLVFYHRQTSLTLNNDGDTVRLLYPDGSLAEAIAYTNARYDQSSSRTETGAWTWDYSPSPGGPNLPAPQLAPPAAPTPTRMPVVPISQARGAARDAAMAVEGRVTVPPGVFGRRVAYLTDGTGGMRIQHWGGDLPSLAEGAAVHVEGRMTTVYGEATLNVRQIARLGGGVPVPPVLLTSGQMGGRWEGMLVLVVGRVKSWESDDIFLEAGASPVQVRLRASTGLERPALETGQHLIATGVVGQINGLWLVLPRWQSDLSVLPARLPNVGERGAFPAPCIAPLVGIYYPPAGASGACPAWWYR
jgi:hypothetical protein